MRSAITLKILERPYFETPVVDNYRYLEDLKNPETGKYIERYLGGASSVTAEQRLRTINLISDLTTGDFGGYQAVLAIHAEGSLEAEKLTILREYDQERVKSYARWMTGL